MLGKVTTSSQKVSFLLTIISTTASRQNQSFQSSEIEIMFYQLDRAAEPKSSLRFSSLSKLNVDISQGEGERATRIAEQAITCTVTGLTAYRFGNAGMKTLAHVCGGAIRCQTPDLYDWSQILFQPEIQGLGATIEALNLLAAKFNAPFAFKATAPVADANRYFHSWFQSTHNVRAGVVEGGHRCETAMRAFYGYQIGQTVPLVPLSDFRPIDANSTLVQPFATKVIQLDSKHHLISRKILREIQAYSLEAQVQRSQVVEPTTKIMWWEIYEKCLVVLNQDQFKAFSMNTDDKFLKSPFIKSVQEDPFTPFIEAIKDVVIEVYFGSAPGKTEMANVNKAAFIKDVKVTKLLGRNFKAMPEVSAKQW